MEITTTSPYQAFSSQGLPPSSVRSRVLLFLLVPFLSGFLNFDAINQYCALLLPDYQYPIQWPSQVQEKLRPAHGPAFAKEVTMGLMLARTDQRPHKRPLPLA